MRICDYVLCGLSHPCVKQLPFEIAALVGSTATEEPATKVKFQSSVNIPGCSTSLSLLGTGQFLYHYYMLYMPDLISAMSVTW